MKIRINQVSLLKAKNVQPKDIDMLIQKDFLQDIIKLEIDEAMNGDEAVKLYEKNLLKECQNPLC